MTLTAFKPPEPSKLLLKLPKCNLHTHLEGSVRPGTFIDLAVKQDLELPFPAESAAGYLQVSGEEVSLADYLDKIMVNYPVLRNYDALKRVAFEAAEDAHSDGVIYLELRAGPVTHASEDLPVEKCIEAMLEGLADAQAQYGITARLIISGLRHHDPSDNLRLARIACSYQEEGVAGFDLAGDEAAFAADLHREAFGFLRDSGLGITVHAGEAGGYQNVLYAVEEIGAERIGHGIHSVESRVALELLRERQVLLEICPTSNVHTGAVETLHKHPVRQLFDYGIPVSIGDDDPITSRTRVSNELMLISREFGFTQNELQQIQLTSLEHSFLRDDSLRNLLREQIQSSFTAA